MYDPQLEKLIAIALKDGVVTDKERQILIKKAIEFGIDLDEFEMELDSRIPTKGADKPLMNIENDNIVKASIKGGENSSSGSGMPLMNIGNDNVIKAEIDASTNITHDNSVKVKGTFVAQQTVINENVTHANSVKVKGTFVAQQTVINETAGSAFIKSISSFMERGSGSKKQIEEQLDRLPNDTNVLLKTLSELCRFILRELNKFYYDKENLGEYVVKKVGLYGECPIKKQIEYAKKILDKLHEVAFDNRDEKLKASIIKLDEIVYAFPKLYAHLIWKQWEVPLNILLWVVACALVTSSIIVFLVFLVNLFSGYLKEGIMLLFLILLTAGGSYGIYKFKINLFTNKMLELEINKKRLQDDDKCLQDLIESIKTV